MSDLPLQGITVVALEQAVAAPVATCRLADAGARIIKLERETGDFARTYDTAANGQSAYFAWANRGKESLTVDIKDPDDVELIKRILSRSDAFIQNLSVGAAARVGLGSDVLRDEFPHLITCDISGYSETGAYRDMKAYDLLIQAESGLVSISGAPGEYGRIGVSLVDISTGLTAALAINEAIVARARTGEGRAIKLSLFDVIADWMSVPLLQHEEKGVGPDRVGLAHPSITPYGGFVSRDGVTIVISVQNDREWKAFTEQVLERPELTADPLYATNPVRMERRPKVDGMVQEFFGKRSKEELVELLKNARIAFGVVNEMPAFAMHPELRRTRYESATGPIEMPAYPDSERKVEDGTVRIPRLGEHSAAIRKEFEAVDEASTLSPIDTSTVDT
ncbi:MAG: CaiB/BaiF CoA-transferase family protein [Gammaproteobacteria bacterium]|nr:CaiB/BaiF CoA-transferase family protein [Gammaproteobacteria bacterium]